MALTAILAGFYVRMNRQTMKFLHSSIALSFSKKKNTTHIGIDSSYILYIHNILMSKTNPSLRTHFYELHGENKRIHHNRETWVSIHCTKHLNTSKIGLQHLSQNYQKAVYMISKDFAYFTMQCFLFLLQYESATRILVAFMLRLTL